MFDYVGVEVCVASIVDEEGFVVTGLPSNRTMPPATFPCSCFCGAHFDAQAAPKHEEIRDELVEWTEEKQLCSSLNAALLYIPQ